MKVGDKLISIYNFEIINRNFIKNNTYIIEKIYNSNLDKDDRIFYLINGILFSETPKKFGTTLPNFLYDYFMTNKKIRKYKLKIIQGGNR